MNSRIPLLGGIPLEGAGYFSSVILCGAFPREDLIFLILFYKNSKNEITTSHRTLLAMTE
jgi:hypothetical protein